MINILEEINIFDVYKSNQDTSNKKSIAFNIKLQPIQKTLVDEEIEDISNKIINVIKEKMLKGIDLFDRNHEYESVKVDNSFPDYLTKNINEYKEFINT